MQKKNVLFIDGIPDNRSITVKKIYKNGSFDYVNTGASNLRNHLKNDFFNVINVTLDTAPSQELNAMKIDAVFNEISDADANRVTLSKVENLRKSLPENIPFFNLPSNVMKTTRDNISVLLQGIDKLHVPKTVRVKPYSPKDIHERIKEEGLKYPVIFRQAGDHGGKSTIKVNNSKEAFHAFSLDGREYYLTQFVDYAQEGLYTKYRLIVVDGEVYLRHIKISNEWMVHHANQVENPETLQEKYAKEFSSQLKRKIILTISEIYHRLNLDYFGVDCFIDEDGNVLVFEVNSFMWAFYNPNHDFFDHYTEEIRKAIIQMIKRKILNAKL
jgi:glutathione synthase/RimK-type ligase-like ATP-grasp enzyme